MAYFLVWADDTSEAGNYGLAIVWIDSHQARMVLMGKLWRHYLLTPPKGLTGHMFSFSRMKVLTICPSPKMDMFVSYPKGSGKPKWQISQLKVCQLLLAGLSVVFPMELNGGDQAVTIDLPESLHTGSSVITDEYPYIEVNIPTLVPEEQGDANLPLGEKQTLQQPISLRLPGSLGSLLLQR